MTVIMEVFSGNPPCQDCLESFKLADEYAEKYNGILQVDKLLGKEANVKFDEYKLSCTPAIIINGKIRIEGICPSHDTLDAALKESGLEIK
jgi:hypothetical protein